MPALKLSAALCIAKLYTEGPVLVTVAINNRNRDDLLAHITVGPDQCAGHAFVVLTAEGNGPINCRVIDRDLTVAREQSIDAYLYDAALAIITVDIDNYLRPRRDEAA